MRSLIVASSTLALLSGCGLSGPEGMFVQLYGRVLTEYAEPGAGLEVSLASSGGAAILETTTDADGWYSVAVLATELEDHGLRLQVDGDGHATTVAWFDLQLAEGELMNMPSHPPQLWSSWSRQLPPLQVAVEAAEGHAEGLILDAATGEPAMEDIGGQEVPLQLDIELREGWNAADGEPVVATVTTGEGASLGRFAVGGIPAGLYTARVLGAGGFTAARFPLLVRGETQAEVRATITRALASDELRAALVWGDSPADLDLHLTGPRASVTPGESQWERFHVWAGEPYHPANASDVHDRVVTMDLLADGGLGPESATVHELRGTGVYRFSVFDHSNAGSSGSEALGWSGALLQLWIGAREPLFFEVSPGGEGNLWLAAEWDSDNDRVYRFCEIGVEEDEYEATSF
jgi:hypothetical protein